MLVAGGLVLVGAPSMDNIVLARVANGQGLLNLDVPSLEFMTLSWPEYRQVRMLCQS